MPMKINRYIIIPILFISVIFSACSRKYPLNNNVIIESKPSIDTLLSQQISVDTIQVAPVIPNEFIQPKSHYSLAFEELKAMLEDRQKANFKQAVFITENAYLENTLNYDKFCQQVTYLSNTAKRWSDKNKLKDYHYSDSTNTLLNAAIFHTLTDTLYDLESSMAHLPYSYDFNDCFARENWLNMFVTKLLITHKGNCHSLPFLYKIIAEELNVNTWLSFTPNHIYLRNKCKKTGWYNTEMTNASFPNEGWLMASGYVSTESIVNGIYMDTLGLKQSIVVCLNDLAKGYLRKMRHPDLEFVITCCDLGLEYYPNYAELLLLKAETHLQLFKYYEQKYDLNVQNTPHPYSKNAKHHLQEMEKSYSLLARYDYREIPEEMFIEWVQVLENNKEKYQNKEISNTFKIE